MSGDVTAQAPLVQHFDLIAQAPDGVARLRELILTLAVQGKLVPQAPSDEPASELLKKIRAEKDRLIAEGKIKRDKSLDEIADDDKQFDLPLGWKFCRLGDLLLSIRSGGTPSKQNPDFWNGDIPWASVKDLSFGDPITDTQDRITRAGLEAGSELAPSGAILICTRMGLGKIGEARIDVAINQDLKAVILGDGVDKQYFINYFKTLSVVGSGMTVAGIKQDELLGFVVPLPPQAEQSRIVTRVEELMQLCDALEANGQLEAQQHAQLVNTLLGTLTQSETPEALADNWQRIATHFDVLLDRPEAVDTLEQTLLQLAVRGLLVPQDPTDEPASVLLQKIRTEKDNLIAQGKIKRDKPLPPITDAEKPFELPNGWQLTRLGALMELISGQHLGPNEYVEGLDGGIPYLTGPAEFGAESPSPTRSTKETRAVAVSGDILITVKGSGVGKLNIVHHSEIAISRQLMAIRPLGVNFDFVLLVLKTMTLKFQAQAVGIAIPGIGREDVSGSLVALPPIAEQLRIVTRVNELLALCNYLRERLKSLRALQSSLSETFLVSGRP